jgi:hypothetical protein
MERLPHEPQNLREVVEADLRRVARLIIKVQDEIDPQFRIATLKGDYCIAVTLPDEPYQRKVALHNVALFMAYKQTLGFTLASELIEPSSVYCVGITPKERVACLARIRREPKPWTAANFGAVEWMPESSIDPHLFEMLPQGAREMSARDLARLEKWFGAKGKFPAVNMQNGELGI